MSTAVLSHKQRRFISEFQIDGNATRAATRSGYSAKTAREIGSENLSKPLIREALAAAREQLSQKTELTAVWVEQRLMLTVESCLEPQPILDPQGVPTGQYTFDATGALRGLELLCKRLRLFSTEEHAPREPEPSIAFFALQQRLLTLTERIRLREEDAASAHDDALLGDAPSVVDAPQTDEPSSCEATEHAALAVEVAALPDPQLSRPCGQCGSSLRPRTTGKFCCFACLHRAQGRTHRLEHSADCGRVV